MTPSKKSSPFPMRFHLINILSNLIGVLLIGFYVFYLQETKFVPTFDYLFFVGIVSLFALISIFVGILIVHHQYKAMWHWYQQAVRRAPKTAAQDEIQQQALNLPYRSSTITMVCWFVAGLILAFMHAFNFESNEFLIIGFFIFFLGTSWIIGPTSALLQYFLAEHAWRQELPLFFVNNDLTEVPGFRLNARNRMIILFMMGTVPLILMAVLTFNISVQLFEMPQLITRLLQLLIILAVSGILLAVILALVLNRSLIKPLEKLSPRLNAIQTGKLDERALVNSNDEIGILASRFNTLADSLQRNAEELDTIYQISREITTNLELDDTLQAILEQVRQIIPYDGGEICLYDKEANVLRVRAWTSSDEVITDTRGQTYTLGQGYTGWVGAERKSLLIPDVDAHEGQKPTIRQIADGVFLNGFLGVPLLVGQKMVGTLEIVSTQKGFFDEHSCQILEIIAPQAAIAIANAEQVIERERNLKAQIEQLKIEIDQVKRTKQVSEITETGFFQQLKEEAKRMRRSIKGEGD